MADGDPLDSWLSLWFNRADKNSDGVLTKKELGLLLKHMNITAKSKDVIIAFNKSTELCKARTRKDKEAVDFNGFKHFYRLVVARPGVETVFKRATQGEDFLPVLGLQRFFHLSQGMDVSLAGCAQMVAQYEPYEINRNVGFEQLSCHGFENMLRGAECDLFDADHNRVNQDMTRPLNEYFIASSHNTYLTEHQLKGPSSVQQYEQVLLKGCRCVELDCYDGSDGEPKVTHGLTLAGNVRLRDVCHSIAQYAFVSSPYPVILSLENHCSLQQQVVMAKLFKDVLGDFLYTDPLPGGGEQLPSPEELKFKIFLKNKKLTSSEGSMEVSDDEEEDCQEQEAEGISDVTESKAKTMEQRKREQKAFEKGAKKLARELSDLVQCCQNARFRGISHGLSNYKPYNINSISESKWNELINSDGEELTKYANHLFVKVYPKGNRIWNSSNPKPHSLWFGGCQIVAMNYQYEGEPMQINDAMFERNGNCGYTLKPSFLRPPFSGFNPKGPYDRTMEKLVTVVIVSGQNLPKAPGKKKDIVDPCVKVEIQGVEEDCMSFKTKTIKNNGINPQWLEGPFEFRVRVPELAFLRFEVRDADKYTENSFVAQRTLPLPSVKKGYRMVHLRNKAGTLIAPASLLVNVQISSC